YLDAGGHPPVDVRFAVRQPLRWSSMLRRLAYTFAFVLPLCSQVEAEEASDRFTLKMRPVRWQLLPEAVRAVYVGPDGRVWHQLSGDSLGRSEAEIRGLLEKESSQPSPMISGAVIALLEPTGRVWFFANNGRDLWRYDGKTWIEHKAVENSSFIGSCP